MEDYICKNCGATLEKDQLFCPKCGTQIKLICSKCGAELEANDQFCSKCGEKVENSLVKPEKTISKKTKSNKKKKPLIITIVVVILVALGTFFVLNKASQKDFEELFGDYTVLDWCTISNDGSYMIIDTNPRDLDDFNNIAAQDAIGDANIKLGFTGALMHKMKQTKSLDGEQTESNRNYIVSWRYHPDHGLEVTYEKK